MRPRTSCATGGGLRAMLTRGIGSARVNVRGVRCWTKTRSTISAKPSARTRFRPHPTTRHPPQRFRPSPSRPTNNPLARPQSHRYCGRRSCGRVVEGTPLLRAQAGNRLEGSNPFGSATCTSQTRDEVTDGAFFLLVSKVFSGAIRLTENRVSVEIGL